MSGQEEDQAAELQDSVEVIMDILKAILKESSLAHEYLMKLSQRFTTQLQEQNPDFFVGKGNLTQSCMPMGISVSSASFAQILEQHGTQEKRCKWCDGILD